MTSPRYIARGYAGSISVYEDVALYREWIGRAAELGFEGAFCIHPNQVAISNELFQPSQEEIAKAQHIIDDDSVLIRARSKMLGLNIL